MSERKKRTYSLKLETNSNYPKWDKRKYSIGYKKNFGNWRGGCYYANTREELLETSAKTLIVMSDYDFILGKYPPAPSEQNIAITIGKIDLSISKTEVINFSLEKIAAYRVVIFDDKETGGQILREGTSEVTVYPKVNHTKCPIYLKQNNCCGDSCTTSCKYYSFHLRANEFNEQRIKTEKFTQTLDYFFRKTQEEAES